jgi:hypothetical protein
LLLAKVAVMASSITAILLKGHYDQEDAALQKTETK